MLLAITGPTCSGKTALLECFLSNVDEAFRVVTTTTRHIRAGERQGRHYNFVSIPEFEQAIEQDQFYEYTRYNENYYGTPRSVLLEASDREKLGVVICDYNGAVSFGKYVRENSVPGICLYLHSTPTKLLTRFIAREGKEAEKHDRMRDMYADHNRMFQQLEYAAATGSSYNAVVPFDTGHIGIEGYAERIVDPINYIFRAQQRKNQLCGTSEGDIECNLKKTS